MSTTNAPRWIFDASDPAKQGLIKAFGDSTPQPAENFIRFGGNEKLLRVVRATGNEDNPHEDIDLTGASITVAAGSLDAFPTSGNSAGEYDGDNTGLESIPAGISAADLQTALNAHPVIVGEGGVTVELVRGAYRIEWNEPGARAVLDWFTGSLTPPARVTVTTDIAGDANTQEVKVLQISQDYWALNSAWIAEASGSVTRTVITQGTASEREFVKIIITGNPTGGKWRITAPQLAVHTINCIANAFGGAASYTFEFTGNTIVSGDYVDLYDDAGPVRVWFNIAAGGGAPAAPAGGRLKEIASGTVDPNDLGANLWAAFAADSGLEQSATTFGYTYVTIRTKVAGRYTVPVDPGFCTFTFFQGSEGRLDGKWFSIADVNGAVGVWFNLSGALSIPSALDDMARIIEVTGIAPNAANTAVATAIASALDADASFAAVAVGSVVTVTDALGGPRLAPSNGDSQLGVRVTVPGYLVASSLPFNASAPQVRDALMNLYDVTLTVEPDLIEYALTAVNVGAQADITASDFSLIFPTYYRGDLSFNTVTMRQAFLAAGTADELTGKLEAQYQFPGEDPVKFYQAPLTVLRSLIDTTELNPLNQFAGVYKEGSVNIPNGQDYVDVVFSSAFTSDEYTLVQSYVENDTDVPPPDIIAPMMVSNKLTTGCRVYLSGAPSNGNCVYKYIARL